MISFFQYIGTYEKGGTHTVDQYSQQRAVNWRTRYMSTNFHPAS